MALSDKARKALEIALASKETENDSVSKEIAEALNAGQNAQAAAVAALGMTSDLSTVAGTYSNAAEPTGAEVDATAQALADEVEARLDAVEAKIDAVIAALKAAGLMAS